VQIAQLVEQGIEVFHGFHARINIKTLLFEINILCIVAKILFKYKIVQKLLKNDVGCALRTDP
jgi:hypothetical protein